MIPVTAQTSAGELLDSIFFSLDGTVAPFTYRDHWMLADKNGTRFPEIGPLGQRSTG